MKKIGIIAAVLVLLVSGLVLAQPGGRMPALMDNVTEEQAAQLAPILEQMEALRAQMRESMQEYRIQAWEALAAAGVISQERLEWMKQGWQLNEAEGWAPGSKGVHHHGAVHGRHGRWFDVPEVEVEEVAPEPFTRPMHDRRMPRGRQ